MCIGDRADSSGCLNNEAASIQPYNSDEGALMEHQEDHHAAKRASDPTGFAPHPFDDLGWINHRHDASPLLPIRRYSKHMSDAAKDGLAMRPSFVAELLQLEEEMKREGAFDDQSCASTVSDITNPTVFGFTESTEGSQQDVAKVSNLNDPSQKDLPPRPATRELTQEFASNDEPLAEFSCAQDFSNLPPPPPPPRPFSGKFSGPMDVSTISRDEPSFGKAGDTRDTPPCPFHRRRTATDIALHAREMNSLNDKDYPPRPTERRLTETNFEPLGDEDSISKCGRNQEVGSLIENRPSALKKLALAFVQHVPVGTHFFYMKMYDNTFVGSDAVDAMLRANLSSSREDAVFLGQRLLKELHLFHHVTWDHNFKDGHYFYRFTKGSDSNDIEESQLSTFDLLKLAEAFEQNVSVSNHVYHLMNFKNTFSGKDAVDYLVNSGYATDREHAVFIGQRLLQEIGLFRHSSRSVQFKDEPHLYYRFTPKCDCDSSSTSDDSSVISMTILLSAIQKQNKGNQRFNQTAFKGISSSQRNTPMRSSLRVPSETALKGEGRSVTFGSVESRVFERTLEVHPSTTSGPSIGLGWNYEDKPPEPMNEVQSKSSGGHRRDFALSSQMRKKILGEWGHSRLEMFLATRVNEKLRGQRKKALNKLTVKSMELEKTSPCSSIMQDKD